MKKGFRRKISDALGITRPTTATLDIPMFNHEMLFRKHTNLSEKQIILLKQMVDNHEKYMMPICKCDIERIFNQCDGEVK